MNPQMMQYIMSMLGGQNSGPVMPGGQTSNSGFTPPPPQNSMNPGGMVNMPMPPQTTTQPMGNEQSNVPQTGGPLTQSPNWSSFNPKSNFGMYR